MIWIFLKKNLILRPNTGCLPRIGKYHLHVPNEDKIHTCITANSLTRGFSHFIFPFCSTCLHIALQHKNKIAFEPGHGKVNKITCALSKDSDQKGIYVVTVHLKQPLDLGHPEPTAKTLIRLSGCPCSSESLLGAQVILLALFFYRSYEPWYNKTNKMSERPAKTQISLGISPVWSESLLCTQWVAKGPRFLHADSEDSDQTGRMPRSPRLTWVFAGRIVILLVLSCVAHIKSTRTTEKLLHYVQKNKTKHSF